MPTQTRVVDSMLAELDQEADITRRLLERVPADNLRWRPHPKSMTIGELALHVASVQGTVSGFLDLEGFDVNNTDFAPSVPESKTQIMERFDEACAEAKARLDALSDDRAEEPWQLTKGGTEVWTIPKYWVARTLVFNHLYHHRGQLSVYLRLLDIAVPVTYGRSADENPFE